MQSELGIILWHSRQRSNPAGPFLMGTERGNLLGPGEIIPGERMRRLSPRVPTVQHIITLSGGQIWC